MGASGSTRRLIVEDSDGAGVVTISDSVARRITGKPEKAKKIEPPPQQTKPSPQSKPPPQVKTESKPSKPKEVIIERPVYYPSPIKDNSKATKEIEAFYQQKLKELENRNAQLQKITTEQFAKAVEEVERKFIKQTGTPVCEDVQSKVYNCYLSNPKETLNCWKQVGAFTSCVERARQNALARRR